MYILIHNALRRAAVIAQAKSLPIPGCPVVHTGIEWAQWVPGKRSRDLIRRYAYLTSLRIATAYEGVLFAWALYKSLRSIVLHHSDKAATTPQTLYSIVLQDNLLYFFGCVCFLARDMFPVRSVS